MLEKILRFANLDSRVRLVLMNGSRVNPNVTKDIFQDYDIVFLVTEVEPFKDEDYVLSYFDEVMIMQKPEDHIWPTPILDGQYIYLVQFTDGSRIDLTILPLEKLREQLNDSLTKVILDKDHLIPFELVPSEDSYLPTIPSEKLFLDMCDEFIWGLGSHIPKTFWRKEWPLLMTLINIVLREPLLKLLEIYIGIKNDYKCSIGKGGKYLEKYLTPEEWNHYLKTYSDINDEHIWDSLLVFHQLFKDTAEFIASTYSFYYPEKELQRAFEFLKHVKALPHDAKSIV